MNLREKIEHEISTNPCTIKSIKKRFASDKSEARKVMEIIDKLVRTGVICQKEGVFFTVRSKRINNVCSAKVVKLGKNFGFVMREDLSGDMFIPGRFLLGAVTGDRVLVEKSSTPRVAGSDEGAVLVILKENNSMVGTAKRINGKLMFVPDDCPNIEMNFTRDGDGGAKNGDKVAVEIVVRSNSYQEDHKVSVAMRFGSCEEAKQCAKALVFAEGIKRSFPEEVKLAAKKLEGHAPNEKELAGRMDLRALPIFTIDSAKTKDIDDAINIKQTAQGFELGVHIADVTHYVKSGSVLDEEAISRATSIYYADTVIPMLPKQLSNGLCSLNEKETRLAFSCLMRLNKNGELTDFKFVKSVIYSRVKGVYDEINDIYAGNTTPELDAKYAEVSSQFEAMKALYDLRKFHRKNRGCMDIESGECKLILDENGRCIDVKKRESGLSESMIEEFMLLANQCSARFGRLKKAPFVYRVHEEPNAEKLERLHNILKSTGTPYKFADSAPTAKELSAILDAARGENTEKIIHTGILRCMSKAKYEPTPKGHYGLVLEDYAHFTSPIRRYPDLAIHRILTDLIQDVPAETISEKYGEFVHDASKKSSDKEVTAMQIERKVDDFYKAEYAQRHLGESFEGKISGLTQRGLFIELENGVEGFVPAASLSERGTMLTEGVRLSDPVSGESWNLGDTMRIVIVRADVSQGKIDFEKANV